MFLFSFSNILSFFLFVLLLLMLKLNWTLSGLLKVMEGRSFTEEIGLVAFACLTISANFRKKNFSVDKYLVMKFLVW